MLGHCRHLGAVINCEVAPLYQLEAVRFLMTVSHVTYINWSVPIIKCRFEDEFIYMDWSLARPGLKGESPLNYS